MQRNLCSLKQDIETIEVTRPVYNRMAYRKDAEGILALAAPRLLDFSGLRLSENPLVLVLESVEKPGNLGAVFAPPMLQILKR